MQGDVILAEPGAVIGFAGPRVIKQTIGQDLPPGFQTAEFLLEHGMIDAVVPRSELRDTTAQMLRHMAGRQPAERSEEHTSELQSQSNLVCRLLLEKKNETACQSMRLY